MVEEPGRRLDEPARAPAGGIRGVRAFIASLPTLSRPAELLAPPPKGLGFASELQRAQHSNRVAQMGWEQRRAAAEAEAGRTGGSPALLDDEMLCQVTSMEAEGSLMRCNATLLRPARHQITAEPARAPLFTDNYLGSPTEQQQHEQEWEGLCLIFPSGSLAELSLAPPGRPGQQLRPAQQPLRLVVEPPWTTLRLPGSLGEKTLQTVLLCRGCRPG
mmetsp:Transcript_34082/g.96604  ORF Transcript_34082/g.96604 Transcript_34082/m.96604 type:complete len:217 (+) Transcript_34082:605-1255(+)